MSRRTRILTGLVAFGALLGLVYSTYSTVDFAKHLDRQLHTLNCSFFPGLAEETQLDAAAEGCQVALFSPFSSFGRDRWWGGIPVSLLAMGLFGFGFVLAVWALLTGRGQEPVVSAVLVLVGAVAVGASLRFFYVSLTELHTVCKLCVGTYIASGVLLLAGVLQALSLRADRRAAERPAAQPARFRIGLLLVLLATLGAAVVVPPFAYARALPDYGPLVLGCERLTEPEDRAKALVPLGGPADGPDAVLVVDPLCVACRAFHRRLEQAPAAASLRYRALLLPLDAECNWMVSETKHPGACLLSKALLCAADEAPGVLAFLYDEQERLLALGREDAKAAAAAAAAAGRRRLGDPDPGVGDGALKAAVVERFPALVSCLDAPETKIKLNKTLQFAVRNRLPLLTPQLYVDGRRLCDEDTDLGLDFALTRLLESPAPAPAPAAAPGGSAERTAP